MNILKKNLKSIDGILTNNKFDETTKKVINFYKAHPFPNYENYDNKTTILFKGDKSYLKSLKKLLGYKKKILEVGCGTGQYSNYLAIGTNNLIYALDPTLESLKIAKKFSEKNNIKNIVYVNGSIFQEIFEKETFDFVFCSGVLHHTHDTYLGFKKCLELVKKDGLILIGLYNSYSRFSLKKIIYKIFGEKLIMRIDPILKEKKFSQESIAAWIKDQYEHPFERSHSIDEVLNWFKMNNVEPIGGIPKINDINLNKIEDEIHNYKSMKMKDRFSKIILQIKMNFNFLGADASLFCILGKKL